MTFLFSDIEGSTRLWQAHGDGAAGVFAGAGSLCVTGDPDGARLPRAPRP